MCEEWIGRGYKDTMKERFLRIADDGIAIFPSWLGRDEFHILHKSNLLRKNPQHYRPLFGNDVSDDIPYWWPTKEMYALV